MPSQRTVTPSFTPRDQHWFGNAAYPIKLIVLETCTEEPMCAPWQLELSFGPALHGARLNPELAKVAEVRNIPKQCIGGWPFQGWRWNWCEFFSSWRTWRSVSKNLVLIQNLRGKWNGRLHRGIPSGFYLLRRPVLSA